ncbi:hypothetical protein O1611_g7779 [Lasiodiplodia mahajangana]|uniref:Uncharacterized protein n=1 Tax=Lasiodiplodia mahajangana TaxID=1108764 RepID=A0ACC2JF62_9PEZI|nr:hypothetical protein O1611_g7779 [Lasiodiplodia mahajangana]
MGSKRKKPDTPLMTPETSTEEHLPPARLSDAPRRSGRLLERGGQALNPQSAEYLKIVMQAEPGQARMELGRLMGKDGAEVALSGLQEMEDRLRNDVKRQKLAIKQSDVQSNGLEKEYVALIPRPIKSQPDILPAKNETEGRKKGNARLRQDTEDARRDDIEGRRLFPDGGDAGSVIDENETSVIKQEGARPPPVNSEYLPLPWKGRLGYACLNTYLRNSNPPDPSQPEHPTKNRPDKEKPAEIERGQKYVEALGLANARDIVKMLRWNDKYGIKFMRLSSEMFPFASHEEYGYKLAPFASEILADAGRVAGELGHRLTTHPGQFTQLGSPRTEVVSNAIRDLKYHNEMLSLLRLPKQQDKDAVMILHMGGVFGDKSATLDRFRANYSLLSDEIKARLVLENDDVSWTVHDLLPICEELNIPDEGHYGTIPANQGNLGSQGNYAEDAL